jgi:hypothetical protein
VSWRAALALAAALAAWLAPASAQAQVTTQQAEGMERLP